MKINHRYLNKNVKHHIEKRYYIIQNYKLKPRKEIAQDVGLSHKQVDRLIDRLKLPLLTQPTEEKQREMNQKICGYIDQIIECYNQTGTLPKIKINLKYLTCIKQSFPKVLWNVMEKETEVINFINKYRKLPNKTTNKKLFAFLNTVQYKKNNIVFINRVNLLKQKYNIKNRIGEKRYKASDTIKELVNFVIEHKRIPTSNGSNYEQKLRCFFSATCLPGGSNYKPELVKPYANLFKKYMVTTHRYYNREIMDKL